MSEMRTPSLRPNLAIEGRPVGIAREGLLGPLVIEPDTGRLYALTSALVIGPEAEVVTQVDEHAFRISHGPPSTKLGPKPVQLAVDLIVAAPLSPLEIDIGMYWEPSSSSGTDFRTPAAVANPAVEIDRQVRIIGRRAREGIARLKATESRFAMRHPLTGETALFDSALELEAIEEDSLIQHGDIGALVATDAGDWIGIVVAGGVDFAFVAPLAPILDRFGLAILEVAAIQAYNAALHPSPSPPPPTPHLLQNSDNIAAASRAHKILEDA